MTMVPGLPASSSTRRRAGLVAALALLALLAAAPGARGGAAVTPTVVDDETPGRFDAASTWGTSAWSPHRHGAGYHFARPSSRDDFALFRVKTPVNGLYDVFGWWPADRGYNAATPIRITTRTGVQRVVADQTRNGGTWTKLGSFQLAAGDDWTIAVSAHTGTPGFVIADAFRVELVVPLVTAVQEPPLGLGDRGTRVRNLQLRLVQLRYLPQAAVNGRFDMQTWHAVVAFQGWQRLSRDGIVGPLTRAAQQRAVRPQPWLHVHRALELDLRRQVLLLVADGRTARAIHVSTAAPGYHTPTGSLHVYRRELRSWSYQYSVWLPYALYFQEGHAFHGYPSVPSYPASHGCVRVPMMEAPGVYAFAPLGTAVSVR